MKRQLKYLLVTILIACISSCAEDEGCSMGGRAMLRCNVYSYKDILLTKAALTKLTVTALDTDSIIINAQANVQELALPLRYTQETTILVLHYGDEGAIKDTLTIRHENTSSFISLECGYSMQQSITGVTYTQHALDSISVKNIKPNVNGRENLQLFYTVN